MQLAGIDAQPLAPHVLGYRLVGWKILDLAVNITHRVRLFRVWGRNCSNRRHSSGLWACYGRAYTDRIIRVPSERLAVTAASIAASGRGRASWFWTLSVGAVLACASPTADSARRDFYFEPLAVERGLLQNTVTAMIQDRDGYVWIGTQGGLHRYDGQGVRLFRHLSDDPGSLPDSFVTALAEGREGELWVGTNTGHLARLDLATGTALRMPSTAFAHDERHQYVRALRHHDGAVWVASHAGVERFDDGSDVGSAVLELAPGETARDIVFDADGDGWVATTAGLYRLPGGGEPQRVAGAPGGASLLVSADGTVWLGGDALYRLDADGRHELVYRHRDRLGREPGLALRAMVEDRRGRLWLSFPGNGLVRLDPGSGQTRHVEEVPGIPASLPEDVINALLIDRSGLLWAGGQIRGTSVADPDGARFHYLADLDTQRTWVYGNSARVLLQAAPEQVWVGTDSDGLKRVTLDTGEFEDFSAPIVSQLDPPYDQQALRVLGLVPDGDEHLWVSAHQGLFHLDVPERSARRVELAFDGAGGGMPALRRADPAADGGLWIGTSTAGLLHFDPESDRVRQFRHDPTDPYSLSDDLVHCVLELDDGRVWVCTNAGLNLLEPGSGHVMRLANEPGDPASLSGDRVRALLQARDGTLWVGTHSGLNRLYQRDDGSPGFERFVRIDGDDERGFTVFNLVEDEDGVLWLGTNEGILSFDPQTRRFRQFDMRDGLQDLEFNGGAQLLLDDGRVMLGGIRGLNLFDPTGLQDSDYLPEVRLLGARFGSAAENVVGLVPPDRLELPLQARMLRLQFGALDFASPGAVRYRYRLEGFDDDWIETSGRPRPPTPTCAVATTAS
ncbi:hypothetical protein FU658_03995 [Alkalisalibacterium limincola]|uniref:Histidine kinase n=1 Tax=Alkalisalibacterium limincola TaxID=2699169 RepID=A0A5C8KY62_9GAMM|nr:hypothetical protein FU658_03995 [Alkalisalibacterium limincola]